VEYLLERIWRSPIRLGGCRSVTGRSADWLKAASRCGLKTLYSACVKCTVEGMSERDSLPTGPITTDLIKCLPAEDAEELLTAVQDRLKDYNAMVGHMEHVEFRVKGALQYIGPRVHKFRCAQCQNQFLELQQFPGDHHCTKCGTKARHDCVHTFVIDDMMPKQQKS